MTFLVLEKSLKLLGRFLPVLLLLFLVLVSLEFLLERLDDTLSLFFHTAETFLDLEGALFEQGVLNYHLLQLFLQGEYVVLLLYSLEVFNQAGLLD